MKKTSEEWSKEYKTQVIDPDGWDRLNFVYSWYEEEITKKEFESRMFVSTCKMYPAEFIGSLGDEVV